MEEKKLAEQMKEKLFYNRKNGYERISAETAAEIDKYAEAYKVFLTNSKTEREAANETVALLKANGFSEFTHGMTVKPGDKVITSKYSGTEVKCDGETYNIVRQGDILAIVE